MNVKISQLPAGTANVNAIVPATNADGTLTEKIRLGDIADLRKDWEVASFSANSFTAAAGKNHYLAPTDSLVAEGFDVVDPPQGQNGDHYFFWNQSMQVVRVGGVEVSKGQMVARYCEQLGPGAGTWHTVVVNTPPSGTKALPLAFSDPLATDASTADIFDVTLTGNTTLANPTNAVNGKTVRWRVQQDAVGGRTVTLGTQFNLPGSASPLAWSTAPNKMDVLAATYHAGRDKWDVVAFVPGY